MNIWLHRISHHAEASYPLLEKGFLTIGFSDFITPEFLAKTKSKDWPYFEKAFADAWPDKPNPRTRFNLWRFVAEMQVGDWVLVPSWGSFSVYRIDGEADLISRVEAQGLAVWNNAFLAVKEDGVHIGDRHLDLGFFRKVSAIETVISRYDFADAALTSRMKMRSTTADITDLAASVNKSLEAFRNKRPIKLHSQILDATQDHLLKLIQNELIPDKLESLIAWYFERIGATEVTMPPKNEPDKQGDADIVAVFEHLKTIYYVQAKHHKGITSQWAAQQVKEYKDQKDRMDDGYSKIAWVVTTAEAFSPECIQLAKENSVGLFAGPDIARMIFEAGIQKLDKAF